MEKEETRPALQQQQQELPASTVVSTTTESHDAQLLPAPAAPPTVLQQQQQQQQHHHQHIHPAQLQAATALAASNPAVAAIAQAAALNPQLVPAQFLPVMNLPNFVGGFPGGVPLGKDVSSYFSAAAAGYPGAGPLLQPYHVVPTLTEALDWDEFHRFNKQGRYCYCRKDMAAAEPALQCVLCKDWFHPACLAKLERPIYHGEYRYFTFSCSNCNSGVEVLKEHCRNWAQTGSIALLHLMIFKKLKWFKMREIAEFLEQHWEDLCERHHNQHQRWVCILGNAFSFRKQSSMSRSNNVSVTFLRSDDVGLMKGYWTFKDVEVNFPETRGMDIVNNLNLVERNHQQDRSPPQSLSFAAPFQPTTQQQAILHAPHPHHQQQQQQQQQPHQQQQYLAAEDPLRKQKKELARKIDDDDDDAEWTHPTRKRKLETEEERRERITKEHAQQFNKQQQSNVSGGAMVVVGVDNQEAAMAGALVSLGGSSTGVPAPPQPIAPTTPFKAEAPESNVTSQPQPPMVEGTE